MNKIKIVNQSGNFVTEMEETKVEAYLASHPEYMKDEDYRPTDNQAIKSTVKGALIVTAIIVAVIGGCVATPSYKEDPLLSGIKERDRQCSSAKFVGNASGIAKFCP